MGGGERGEGRGEREGRWKKQQSAVKISLKIRWTVNDEPLVQEHVQTCYNT